MITGQELALVETAMKKAVASNVDLLVTASRHVIRSGGKRLRPKIVLLGYKAIGGHELTHVVPLAAAVELLHAASLVHDDINDRSELRRGSETVSVRWGSDLALLVGDFVFIKFLSLLSTFDPRSIQILADCCTAVVEGETRQILSIGDTNMTESDYLSIVSQKTASLFAACAELGGLAAGGSGEQIQALREYGLNIGMAFQIRDDTLDLKGSVDQLGKPTAQDIEQGKMSLAVIFALNRLEKTADVPDIRDPVQVIALLEKSDAFSYAAARASAFAAKAKQSLSILPQSEARTALCELADFAIVRNN
ncbi:MAG: polyprenyl synthetase family protein [Anaerolineae bacterium]|nr:polyprenyl synthetase family protein [Anaerolineae bacterium]